MFGKKTQLIKKDVQDQYKHLATRAKNLNGTREFQEYRRVYITLREKLINEMLNCDEADPLRYAFQMNSYVERIKALGVLVREVKEDIEKGASVNEEPEAKE